MDLRPLPACGTLLAGLLLTGCAAATPNAAQPPKASPKGLEELARDTGCTVQVQTNASELRQGACQTGAGQYTLLTFATDQAAGTWLSEAKIWGGTYLVGTRWVIVGTPQQLATFQNKVGGNVQSGDSHSHG